MKKLLPEETIEKVDELIRKKGKYWAIRFLFWQEKLMNLDDARVFVDKRKEILGKKYTAPRKKK